MAKKYNFKNAKVSINGKVLEDVKCSLEWPIEIPFPVKRKICETCGRPEYKGAVADFLGGECRCALYDEFEGDNIGDYY